MKVKSPARGKLLDAARSLILTRGFSSTTVEEICTRAGVSKGSFYHCFDSKEDLGLEVLEDYVEFSGRRIAEGPYTRLDDPVERAFGYLDHVETIARGLWFHGCLVGSFTMDLAASNARFQAGVSRVFKRLTAEIAEIFEPLARRSRQPDGPTGEDMAVLFVEIIEGAILLAKAHDDWDYVPRALASYRKYASHLIR